MGEERQQTMDPYLYPDQGSAIIASKLAEQLGTDPVDLDSGRVDMRRFSVIEKGDRGLLMYAAIRAQKSRAWGTILNWYLNLNVSVGGRGRRDIIRMEAVSKGLPTSVESEIRKPNWVARNIYQRDWEQSERERLGIE